MNIFVLKRVYCGLICLTILSTMQAQSGKVWALALHGGAGTITRKQMTAEKDSTYRFHLDKALGIGERILESGGSSMDAVEQVIIYMEDCPYFNAGKGAVFNREGRVELDASLMDGSGRQAGAAGSVEGIKNPIRLARAIMENSPHVFLVGEGAKTFGVEVGLDTADESWFYTEERWNQHLRAQKKGGHSSTDPSPVANERSLGTVGCVALDRQGNLAAGTSTGGMTNKRKGRLGDSPVIGAGTFADNRTCAVSCTGHGEHFIRNVVSFDLHARMLYGKQKLSDAADQIVFKELKRAGAEGGFIAIDRKGNVVMPFNSSGMYRASSAKGQRKIEIYGK
ncbi:MAG: isoaspartyl peptidase/L-asparaginase [Saprospiraceae bacterium]|nr:isoaspartyl peptidase/L-asparaginase [Saprospiraceae bacterium]